MYPLIVILSFFSTTHIYADEQSFSDNIRYEVLTTTLHIVKEPQTESAPIRFLKKGDYLQARGPIVEGQWLPVHPKGWVNTSFILAVPKNK